jgi:TonB-linked SusC/RagA family outer membrane protein
MKNESNRKTLLRSLSFRLAGFFLAGILILIPLTVMAQQRTISGTVTGTDKLPFPGVSVSVKGTTVGITTGIDGKYILSIPSNAAILVFSFVGMQSQEIAIGAGDVYDAVLSEGNLALEEVVVVGYGTQKKVNLTGAVSSIKIDDKLVTRALPNVSSGMSGLVSGLSVIQNSGMAGKNDVSMLIRGMGTVNNASPLVVVDGMPDVDINRINMNDIETISILKDATSSAIYGSRAANGVILITTKTGRGQDKAKIEISSSYAVENPTKAYQFMADYPRALTLHQRVANVNTLKANWYFKDGTIDQWMALDMIDPLRYPSTDWWKIMMRNGTVKNNNFSASGGNDKSNFFISLGLMEEKGLQINNDYSRYNARFNYDYKLRKNMNIGAKFDGNWSKYVYALEDGFTDDDPSNTAGFDMQYAIAGITPFDPVTGYYGGVMAYNEDPQAYNPYTLYINNLNRQNRQEANTGFYWDWSPIKGLTARIDYTLRYYNQFRYTAAIPNRSYNFQTKSFGSRVYVGDNAGIANYTNTGFKTQLNGQINYQRNFGTNHEVRALFVYSEEYWYDRNQSSSRNDRLHPSLHEINAALTDIQSTGGSSSTEGLQSYIGRVNYTAYNKYLFEASFRYDGSSKFLPGSQFGFFPSASLGWRFTEENFIKSLTENWLSSGKLRLSYGGLGNNSGVGRYEQQETLAAAHYMVGGVISKGFVNRKMVNASLSWETTYVMNIGLDLGFLKGRLTTELDYYDRLTTGMNRPSSMSILLTGAYDAPRRNIGDLRNRGLEGNFTWRDQAGNFSYSANLNASYNKTTLEKWNDFLSRGYTFLNMPYHFLYTYEDIGIAQTWQDVYNATPQGAQPGDILRKDLNGDGRIDGNDMKAYPNFQRDIPTTNFAVSGNVAWKGFDLSFLFQGAAGRKDYWINIYNNMNFGNQRYASTWSHWTDPWSVENRGGAWPRLGGSGNNRSETTFWLDNLAYLRFKNFQLGYTLPKNWLQKLGITNIRIYGSAENMATLTKFRGLDPEKTGNASDAYPLNKSYSFGIIVGI